LLAPNAAGYRAASQDHEPKRESPVTEDARKAAAIVRERVGELRPQVGIVLGSGLGGLAVPDGTELEQLVEALRERRTTHIDV